LIAAAVIGMAAGPAMAQSDGHDGDHHSRQERHDNGHRNKHDRGDDRRDDRRDDHRYSGMHDRGRHEGWYKRGGHVPREYRTGRYVVTDWHRENLRQPPRGYHWVRSDNGDFLLVAVATGIVMDLLLHH
jgi:Ni/Co efflux regulator RcnB